MTVPPCLFAGGPKLRKWYGAPDLLPKDGSDAGDEDEFPGNALGNYSNMWVLIFMILYMVFSFQLLFICLRNLVSFFKHRGE